MNEAKPSAPRRWSEGQILFWFVLFAFSLLLFGPPYLEAFRPPEGRVSDFHQEWLSARNFAEGGPVYTDQRILARRFWGAPPELAAEMLPWNAHPPVSAMLALPFGRFSYSQAQLFWNLANVPFLILSIVLVIRDLGVPFAPASILPLGALILGWYSIYSQIQHGQLNILLMALITTAWSLDRRGRSTGAGLALGAAAALKLFPAFLFLYFLAARNGRAILAGAIAFLALNGAAIAILGLADFDTYFREVIPSVANYQSSRQNVSLAGFWLRLFDPHPNEHIVAFATVPLAALAFSHGTRLAVALLVARAAWKSRTPFERDRAFAIAVFGMLLVSPIAWPHYFLMLAMPLAWLWMNLAGRFRRIAFWCAFAILWLPNYYFPAMVLGKEAGAKFVLDGKAEVLPWQSLSFVSLPHYALLVLFALSLAARTEPAPTGSVPPRSEP
jgi:Glycosyltransferase family 87